MLLINLMLCKTRVIPEMLTHTQTGAVQRLGPVQWSGVGNMYTARVEFVIHRVLV